MIEIFKVLAKKKVLYVCIIFQFSISILYFFVIAASIQKVFYVNIEVPRELDVSDERVIHIEINSGTQRDNFEKFVDDICQNGIETIGSYQISSIFCEEINTEIAMVELDKGVNAIKNISVKEGEFFCATDYKYNDEEVSLNNPIPALIGTKLQEKYGLAIGDVISDSFNNLYYEIKGVMDEGNKWFAQLVSEGMILSLDNQIVIPRPERDLLKLNYYATIKDSADKNSIIRYVEESAEANDVIMEATFVSDELQEEFDAKLLENKYWMIFVIVIMIMISVGTTILFSAQMDSRKHEIGIRMSVGYSIGKIIKQLIGEILTVDIIAFVVAFICGRQLIGDGTDYLMAAEYSNGYYISFDIILVGIFLMCLMCLPTIVMIWIRAKRLQPRELIGGNE